MDYVNLGRTGLKVSRLCLGCMSFGSKQWREWVLGDADSRPIIRAALNAGINFFDTANMYSVGVSEEIVGKALADMAPRDQVVIATKVFHPMGDGPNDRGLSRKHIMDQAHASLKRLRTDHIDLYQIHRWDPATPVEETLRALDDLVRQGKVLYIGASSMWAHQFSEALQTSDGAGLERFVTMQNHYNLIYREEEREMIPLCLEEGVGLLPWSPLARGYLTGARRRGEPEPTVRAKTDDYTRMLYSPSVDFDVIDRLTELARQRGEPPSAVALAWLLHKPGVVAPIVGTTRAKHLDDALRALDIQLSAEDMAGLEEPYKPHEVRGHT